MVWAECYVWVCRGDVQEGQRLGGLLGIWRVVGSRYT